MKTKDFKRMLNSMGFNAVTGSGVLNVKLEETNLAIVSMVDQYEFTTRWVGFHELCDSDKENLYNLLDEYARTPVEGREPPKKYRYRFIPNITFNYPDCHIARRVQFPSGEEVLQLDTSKEETAERRPEYHFTDKEVEQYTGKDRKLFELCEKIEVSEK